MREKMWIWLAEHSPRKLVYWSAIRMFANASTGAYGDQIVPELKAMDALKRWEA